MKFPVTLLVFADRRGLEFPLFNTFRLGGAWAKRLTKGDGVLLAFKHEVIGCAKVKMVHTGKAIDVLNFYARFSHVELALAAEQGEGYRGEEAPQRRVQSMQRTYGPHKFTPESTITVVSLSPSKILR